MKIHRMARKPKGVPWFNWPWVHWCAWSRKRKCRSMGNPPRVYVPLFGIFLEWGRDDTHGKTVVAPGWRSTSSRAPRL